MIPDTVAPYHRGFREFAATYEAFGFEELHRDATAFIPTTPGLLLDVGAGSGRDAAWFAGRGWEVVAAEPAAALRQEAARLHASATIRWIEDRLPGLAAVHRLGLGFDIIWLSGVWMHLPPEDRPRAMRKLATLLKPGGRMVLTLRHGPAPEGRPMWPVHADEVERLGLDHGLALRVATRRTEDRGGRTDISWQTVILDLPDDGSGALPLLRGVILRQEKSSTYKLALLRCIARIADASPNVAREAGDDVELPLGLIALFWIRMYKPLFERGLPQMPRDNPAFAKDAFRALAALAPFDLRPGASFADDVGTALRAALAECAQVIANMPARHLTYSDDKPVFVTSYGRRPHGSGRLVLDHETLWGYGVTKVPLAVWQALRRMAAWLEPMLVAEWVRKTKEYARTTVSTDDVLSALRWLEPERDTAFVRGLAQRRIARGDALACVWSQRKLHGRFDIDHCLPWSAWPCGDLWNLLPVATTINRDSKRDRIVGAAALAEAQPRILDWWQETYLDADAAIRARFIEEARTTLPLAPDRAPDLDELFAALDFRRLRLRQETHLPEWAGASAS